MSYYEGASYASHSELRTKGLRSPELFWFDLASEDYGRKPYRRGNCNPHLVPSGTQRHIIRLNWQKDRLIQRQRLSHNYCHGSSGYRTYHFARVVCYSLSRTSNAYKQKTSLREILGAVSKALRILGLRLTARP